MQRPIVRYPSRTTIGTIDDRFPFEIEWTEKSSQADKDTFARWLTDGITTTEGGRTEDGTFYTEVIKATPKHERFFDILEAEARLNRYWIQEREDEANADWLNSH